MDNQCKAYLLVAGFTALLLFFASPVGAQIQNRVKLVDAAKNKTPVRTGPRLPRTVGVRKVDTRVVTKIDKVRVSSLSVTTEPDATVLLQSVGGPKPVKSTIKATADGSAIFDDLKPGTYKVQASKDEYETSEADKVIISAQKAHVLDLGLKQVTYRLKIQTNLNAGKVQFSQAIETGKTASGGITSQQLGSYCVVAIQKNGEAVIADLKKGYYDIDIIPESLEYEVKETGVNVPDDIDQDDGSTALLKTFQIDLEKNISREEFGTTWIPSEWILPSAWRLDRGLKVRSEGVGLPGNPRFRQYVDFEVVADLKVSDSGTAAFVLRAQDDKNYYLLQLAGTKGAEPSIASLRAVKDGVIQREPLSSVPIPHFAKTFASNDGFRVLIQGDTNKFAVWIEDSGRVNSVGVLTDQYSTFKKGAIGLAGVARSNFDVSFFRVCPTKCR